MITCNKSNLKRNVKIVVYDLKSLQNKAEQNKVKIRQKSIIDTSEKEYSNVGNFSK